MSQPYNSLKLSQKRTLDAWKIAINSVNIEHFSDELKTKIEQIERELYQNNYQVIDKIPEIVKENADLYDAYKTARKELAEDYDSQEKDKIAIPYNSNYATSINSNYGLKIKGKINRQAIFILQELETYPLTLEDLKCRLNLQSSEVHELVKKLWNERKINKVSGNIWYSVFPITKPREFDIIEDDQETYFNVTSLGKMQLHRFINSR